MTFRMTPEDAQRFATLEGNDVVGAGNKSLAQAIMSVFGGAIPPETKMALATPEEIAPCEPSHTGRYLNKRV